MTHADPPAEHRSQVQIARTPLVSVVVAVYNGERHIEETCRSALAQDYTSLEVVVVDDGSTDATARLVAELAKSEPRLRLIRQPNQGVAAARNRAIAAARGELIAPLDADDLWDRSKIARQVQRLQESAPETGLVYCWWVWIDTAGVILDRSPPWRIEGRILERLVEVNVTGNASVPLFRRSAIDAVGGYRPELREGGCQGCEDWDLALRVAEKHSVAMVPAVLVAYRRRPDSMSTQSATMARSRAQVMTALAARQPSISPDMLRRSQGQFALHLAGVAFWSGDFLQACLWGLQTRPFPLMIAVLPHVARIILQRLIGPSSTRPTLRADGGSFDQACPLRPMIPYDRIYARHWRRHDRE